MKATISFIEIKDYLVKHTSKSVDLSHIASDTIRITYTVGISFFTKDISVDVKLEKVEDSNIYISYSGGLGTELLVSPLLSFIKNHAPNKTDFIEDIGDKTLKICLHKIEKMDKVFDYISLKSITFDTTGVFAEICLK